MGKEQSAGIIHRARQIFSEVCLKFSGTKEELTVTHTMAIEMIKIALSERHGSGSSISKLDLDALDKKATEIINNTSKEEFERFIKRDDSLREKPEVIFLVVRDNKLEEYLYLEAAWTKSEIEGIYYYSENDEKHQRWSILSEHPTKESAANECGKLKANDKK